MSDLETLISRYAAGEELPVAERERVERELDKTAEANEMLATEHRLTELLRSTDPLPPINFDRLAKRISANIPQTPAAGTSSTDWSDGSSMKIRRPLLRWSTLALAASVLIAVGVAIPMLSRDSGGGPVGPGIGRGPTLPTPNETVVTVRAVDGSGSMAVAPTGVQNVTVGPSRALAERPTAIGRADASTSRPSKITISGDRDAGASDNPLSPR